MAEPERLAKRVAALVPCSRREAELYIEGGWVRVDGEVIDEPQFRVADQRIEIDPAASTQSSEPVTLLLHKPAGMNEQQALQSLTPATRFGEDPSGIRPLKKHFRELRSLLELPAPASGLAVFSQDGRIIRKLVEDAATMEQELVAQVTGTIAENGLARLCHGLVFEGWPLPPVKASWQSEERLRFAMKGVRPEMVEWMCAQVGLRLAALRRIRIGRLPMAGLPEGRWRYLLPGERF
jgi:23S rRNA pseudouridine2604 synthase